MLILRLSIDLSIRPEMTDNVIRRQLYICYGYGRYVCIYFLQLQLPRPISSPLEPQSWPMGLELKVSIEVDSSYPSALIFKLTHLPLSA
jgi:hypothetical protein